MLALSHRDQRMSGERCPAEEGTCFSIFVERIQVVIYLYHQNFEVESSFFSSSANTKTQR